MTNTNEDPQYLTEYFSGIDLAALTIAKAYLCVSFGKESIVEVKTYILTQAKMITICPCTNEI